MRRVRGVRRGKELCIHMQARPGEHKMTQKIGFVGLGAMGEGMSKNLVQGGFEVRGHDIDRDAVRRLQQAGGAPVASSAQAAQDADLLFVCVFDATQAEEVLFAEDGAVNTLPQGATVIMNTTVSPAQAQSLEARLRPSGHLYVDAPITGGKLGADQGTLTTIAAGSDAALAAADAAFRAVGKRVYRIGDAAGAASRVKMINQLLCGIHVAAACEGIALAARAGADPKVVYDVITHGAGNSFVFENFIPHVFARDYGPRGVVDIFTKDLGIALDTGHDLDFPLPVTAAALQQFLAAAAAGHGRADGISVVKIFEQLAGMDVAAAVKDH